MIKKPNDNKWVRLFVVIALFTSPILFQGCDTFGTETTASNEATNALTPQAPVSADHPKLRHPQLLDQARGTVDGAGKGGSDQIHLMLAFNGYEADGITKRVMNRYDVTRRILNKYEDDIRLKVQLSKAFDGISIKINDEIMEDFLADLAQDPDFAWAEPDVDFGQLWVIPEKKGHHEDQLIPWGIARIGGGLDKPKNDKKVHVYIMDSGVSKEDINVVEHKDFTMLFQNREEEYWDDAVEQTTPVYDPDNAGNPADESGHGTHIASTLGAKDDKKGMLGAAPNVKIHSLKVLTAEGRTDITTVTAAVDYVTEQKLAHPDEAIIVNMSFGMDIGTTAYNSLDEAVARSIEAGVVYVVSAGNDGRDASTYSPAHVEGVITVGAYNEFDAFSSFSNYGAVVDILAPGENILALSHLKHDVDHKEHVLNSGTSFAAPHVTATAAFYMGQHPKATPAEVKEAIIANARTGIKGTPPATTNLTVYAGDFSRDKKKDKPFKFKKAKYDEKKQTLKIEGEGPRLERIVLHDGNDQVLAETSTGFEHKWKVELEEVEAVPCTISVTLNGETQTQAVEHRPGSCTN
ncbi:MAG: S8 family peptidase [Bacteroidota bacterium]